MQEVGTDDFFYTRLKARMLGKRKFATGLEFSIEAGLGSGYIGFITGGEWLYVVAAV